MARGSATAFQDVVRYAGFECRAYAAVGDLDNQQTVVNQQLFLLRGSGYIPVDKDESKEEADRHLW
jgi:hypothetical protein